MFDQIGLALSNKLAIQAVDIFSKERYSVSVHIDDFNSRPDSVKL